MPAWIYIVGIIWHYDITHPKLNVRLNNHYGWINNIQASWVKLGIRGAQQLLSAGVNDLGGTLMDENISRAAGAAHGQRMETADLEEIVAPLGRPLVQRTTLYGRP